MDKKELKEIQIQYDRLLNLKFQLQEKLDLAMETNAEPTKLIAMQELIVKTRQRMLELDGQRQSNFESFKLNTKCAS